MKAKTLLIALLAVPWLVLAAQHGTSPEGLDTWTGQITALNPDKQEITLTARRASETFILPKEEVKPGEKGHILQFPDLSLGQSVRVVYLRMKHEINGKWVKINTIVTIEIAPPKGS
ncbi:MAG: hypothetical protein ACHP79_02865 [Terriglobales bacterium]